MFAWLTKLISAAVYLFEYLGDKQLLDAGMAKQRDEDNKANEEARKHAKKTKAEVSAMSDAELDELLHSSKRK